ncbi:hypothetical protein Scep_020403 [Stephania cephalantha]|uniref:BHLH domain-containing protein n=1 Tax=Stephania cephalantha TaxID=152367 RepID=A0AAP0NNY7_9MAGN
MGKDCATWVHNHYSNWQSANPNCNANVPNQVQINGVAGHTNLLPFMCPANGSLPIGAAPQLGYLTASHFYQQNGWLNSVPCHHQVVTPAPRAMAMDKISALANAFEGKAMPNLTNGPTQKRFIIFDQSGNRTNVIFSSVNDSPPIQPVNLGFKKPFDNFGSNEELVVKKDSIYESRINVSDKLDGNLGSSGYESEMQEDSEELDALLYSDGDSDYDDDDDDDEESSTGHSPSKITEYKKCKGVEQSAEEIASSDGTTKRKRRRDSDNDASSVMDTASSVKYTHDPVTFEDEAESSCVRDEIQEEEETHSSPVTKRLKKERIRETISILQSIIPDGNGNKDAMFVLDEAISYLKHLKLMAISLGVVTP